MDVILTSISRLECLQISVFFENQKYFRIEERKCTLQLRQVRQMECTH